MIKRSFLLFVFSLSGLLFISFASFAEDVNDKKALLESQRNFVDKSTNELVQKYTTGGQKEPLDKIGFERLPQEDLEKVTAVYETAEKILADKSITEAFRIWTIQRKTTALIILAYEETPRYFPLLGEMIDELDKEKNLVTLLQRAEYHFLQIGSFLAINDKKSQVDLKSLTERIIFFVKEHPGERSETLIRQLLANILKLTQDMRDKRLVVVTPLLIQYFTEIQSPIDVKTITEISRRAMLPGKPMEFGGYDLDGKLFDLEQLTDKVVLIQFWGTWCPHCKEQIPELIDLYEKYHSLGLEIIGVNTGSKGDDNPQAVRHFLATTPFGVKQKMISWTILHEAMTVAKKQPTMTKYYGIEEIPFLILVGRNGLVIEIQPLLSTLDAKIKEALYAVELTPEEQAVVDAARKKEEAELDKKIQEELKNIGNK